MKRQTTEGRTKRLFYSKNRRKEEEITRIVKMVSVRDENVLEE